MKQIGYIGKNVQGNRVYSIDGASATLASQTGGLAERSVGLYLIDENYSKGSDNLTKRIKHIGVGHHPFSKKYEFKGFFDEPVPCLIATDYKAPKTVLELHYEYGCGIYEEQSKGSD